MAISRRHGTAGCLMARRAAGRRTDPAGRAPVHCGPAGRSRARPEVAAAAPAGGCGSPLLRRPGHRGYRQGAARQAGHGQGDPAPRAPVAAADPGSARAAPSTGGRAHLGRGRSDRNRRLGAVAGIPGRASAGQPTRCHRGRSHQQHDAPAARIDCRDDRPRRRPPRGADRKQRRSRRSGHRLGRRGPVRSGVPGGAWTNASSAYRTAGHGRPCPPQIRFAS